MSDDEERLPVKPCPSRYPHNPHLYWPMDDPQRPPGWTECEGKPK